MITERILTGAPMRTFLVRLVDGTDTYVTAQYHDCSNPGGHLIFGIEGQDQQFFINRMFHCDTWEDCEPVDPNSQDTPTDTDDRLRHMRTRTRSKH